MKTNFHRPGRTSVVAFLTTILPLLATTTFAAPKTFLIVEQEQPGATIVTAAQPSENASAAAKELQHYIQKITGAKLPMATDAENPSGRLILIGPSKLTQSDPALRIPSGLTPALREEGFVIKCTPERLVAAGNDEGPYYGTRYAVVELLHRLGARWFMPGEFGEVLPHTNTLALAPAEIRQKPDFVMRNYWQHARDNMAALDQEWKIHHKMNP
ncbi:MAG TPA: alpha-glucuronidase family glycosyl hydrolase, partial [Verrucomicrobiae bacterium]